MIYIDDLGDVRHIRNVLRMKKGDGLTLCDGAGREYDGVIEDIGDASGGAIAVSVTDVRQSAEPRSEITLYQCMPKQGKMETVIQKSTELGAARFVPVFSARSVPKAKNAEAKLSRWRRVAEEASKQSGRGVVPQVEQPVFIAEAAAALGDFDIALFPYENERGTTIKSVLRGFAAEQGDAPSHSHIAIIIGPEGGFTGEEAGLLVGAGARPCSLGTTILRTETAGPAAIAMALYELEL
jgi:16S rRNA (uracil1498-N3)-methyltransferase